MCLTKLEGGLAFQSFMNFNQALSGKQAWSLFKHSDLLLSKVLEARYFPRGEFLTSSFRDSPSLTWRSIVWCCDLLYNG